MLTLFTRFTFLAILSTTVTLFLCLLFFILSTPSHAIGANILYVNSSSGVDSGDCTGMPCQSVGYALEQATSQDIIHVAAGNYTESLTLDKSVSLIGSGANETIIHAVKDQRVLTITGATITNSTIISGFTFTGGKPSNDNGGGFLIDSSAPTIQYNRIISNFAGDEGGGLYITNSLGIILRQNSIEYNKAITGSVGGGIALRISPNAMISSNLIKNNSAWRGGGMYLFEGDNTIINHNLISDNLAGNGTSLKLGGGVYVLSSDSLSVTDNLVQGNHAWNEGGGLFFQNSPGIILERNIVRENRSGTGGGIRIGTSNGSLLVNNVIIDNEVNTEAGGLLISSSTIQLFHNTIASNELSGIQVNNSTISLTNHILVSHTVGITETDAAVHIDGILWYSNTLNYEPSGNITTTYEYTGAPVFAADGYHLTSASVALNKGVNTTVTTDIDLQTRPFGTAELGADEAYFFIHLPIIIKGS